MTNKEVQEYGANQIQALTVPFLFAQTKSALSYLKKKWLLIALGSVLLATLGALLAIRQKPLYRAEISFALDENESAASRSGFSEFSEQLGLEPIDGGKVFSNAKNIEELLKSRLLIEKTLRSGFSTTGDTQTFADFFLDSLKYREKWMPGKTRKDFRFNDSSLSKADALLESGLMKNMYRTILSKYLQVGQKTKGTSILSVTLSTEHELFSKYFLERLISEVSQYYISARTRRTRTNLEIIEKRADSVKKAYMSSVYGRAAFADADINLVRETPSVPFEKIQTDVQILKAAYVELSRNLETARTSLLNETPLIEIIDSPILPLDRISSSPVTRFAGFGLFGALLTSIILLTLRLFRHLEKMTQRT